MSATAPASALLLFASICVVVRLQAVAAGAVASSAPNEAFLHKSVREHTQQWLRSATVQLGVTNHSDEKWLQVWQRTLPLQLRTVAPGLIRSWHESANRAGVYASESEMILGISHLEAASASKADPNATAEEKDEQSVALADAIEAETAHTVPPTARGFRALLDNIMTKSETDHFRRVLRRRPLEANLVDSGREVAVFPSDFPPGALERIRAAVTAVVVHHGEGTHDVHLQDALNASLPGHVVFSASNTGRKRSGRGPIQFLSAQIIERGDGGGFGSHVDSSVWSSEAGCRLPMAINSLSAYTTDIFLTDPNSYGDGEIAFTHEPLQALKRAEGDALLFTSDVTNPHEVRPVRGGTRHALVIWWHDEPALAPLVPGELTPDVSIGQNPVLEAASQALQKISHLTYTEYRDSWSTFLQAAARVPKWIS